MSDIKGKKYVNVTEAAKMLGVSKKTLQRWDREGKLVPAKTMGKHRRYDYDEMLNYYDNDNSVENKKVDKREVIGYCRVSSSDQSDDLDRQVSNVSNFCIAKGYSFRIIKDLGSGLNYNKKGLTELINLILEDKVSRVVINYKDRLIRFGYEIIELLCKKYNVELEIINNTDDKTFEQELVDDVLSLITVFSAKLYGSRSKKAKKFINSAKKIINEK